eukprot:11642271-Alexandrium_andersonii.AAC.1
MCERKGKEGTENRLETGRTFGQMAIDECVTVEERRHQGRRDGEGGSITQNDVMNKMQVHRVKCYAIIVPED